MNEPLTSRDPGASAGLPQPLEQHGVEGPFRRDGPAAGRRSLSPAFDWRAFVRLRAGPLLYCLSTASVLFGIAQIVTPVLATTGALSKTLPCVGVLNVYELALLGALVLIVVWRNVTDDAVFLAVLVALFLVASGMTLATVANDNPLVVLLVGAASFAVAAVKLWVLRRAVHVRFERLLLVALGAVLAWNFFMPAAMALVVKHVAESERFMRTIWLAGWLVTLASGALMLVHASRAPDGGARRASGSAPFLHSAGMGWVFALVVFFAVNVHQYALTYIFDVPVAAGDFLPVVVLSAVLAIELMRAFGKPFDATELVVALIPLAAVLCIVLSGSFIVGLNAGLGVLWHPCVVLGLGALAFTRLSIRRGRRSLLWVAFCYALAAVLTSHVGESRPAALDWQTFSLALAGVLFLTGLILRRAGLALAAVVVLSVVVVRSGAIRQLAARHELAVVALAGLVAGFGTLVVYFFLPTKLSRWIARLGALVLAGSTVACFGGPSRLDYPLASGLVVALVGAAVWLRARDMPVALVGAFPLLRGLYVGTSRIRGWRYVALGFVLLAIGVLLSLRKGHAARHAAAAGASADHPLALPEDSPPA